MKRLMSDSELRHRRKVQGKIGRTTSTLGLTGAAIGGTALLATKKPGSLKYIRKVPGLKHASRKGLGEAGLYTSLAAGGIGGVGGFNQASIYSAESRKRQPKAVPKQKVAKAMDKLEMGYYGEEGHPVELPVIEPVIEIEKAWSPTANPYDPEAKRHKRSKVYEGATAVGGGAGATYSALHGFKAGKAARKLNGTTELKALKSSKAVAHGGKALAGAAVVGAAASAHGALKRKQKNSWQSYAKRDSLSAFGIDHTEWTQP